MCTINHFVQAGPSRTHCRYCTTLERCWPDLIVVRVSDHAAAVLLCVDGFSLAALHGVDEGYAPGFLCAAYGNDARGWRCGAARLYGKAESVSIAHTQCLTAAMRLNLSNAELETQSAPTHFA